MSCRFTNIHAEGECCSFQPRHFVALLEQQQIWLQLLICMTLERWQRPEGAPNAIIRVMLGDRARWLRN